MNIIEKTDEEFGTDVGSGFLDCGFLISDFRFRRNYVLEIAEFS